MMTKYVMVTVLVILVCVAWVTMAALWPTHVHHTLDLSCVAALTGIAAMFSVWLVSDTRATFV
jgi:hypothetical protein